MIKRLCAAILILALGLVGLNANDPPRRIALTYDDAPKPDGAFMTGAARTQALIQALKDGDVSEAGIFVTTSNIKSDIERARVLAFANAGHIIANHSHSHSWLKDTGADAYLADIDRAEAILKDFPNRRPWFRFPYLDEGRKQAKHDAVHAGLKARGLMNGYVTVDTFDWYIDGLAAKAKRSGICTNETAFDSALKTFYVNAIVEASVFFDDMAREYLGRSPAHTLLLHENDIAAMYADDLAEGLRNAGWEIIPVTEAFKDPLANDIPKTLFNGGGRIAAHARVEGADYKDLFHWSADEKAIDKRFNRDVLRVCETPNGAQ